MERNVSTRHACALSCALLAACSATAPEAPHLAPDSGLGPPISLGGDDGADAGGYVDGSAQGPHPTPVDGGYEAPDGSVYPEDRFVLEVASFTQGACGGFGAASLPGVVMGPPVGAGDQMGSVDVVSLGMGGEIVVRFGDNAIVDGPGVDFIVFENAFFAGGDPSLIAADLAEVSVSDDGETWKTFPCTPGASPPYGTCAGWRPVYTSPESGISPFSAETAGGDPYDLADVGLARARYVRIRDRATKGCPDGGATTTAGFDLDAVAIVNAEVP